jgi:hypothetical protein
VSRSISRNASCPCGSGQKYKRCCLAAEQRIARGARLDDAVGARIQDWSAETLADEIGAALEELASPERVLGDADIEIFAVWFHNDRELPGGGTPAERYAALPELAPAEREAASRIARARLGLYRVLAVEPGRSLTLEDVFGASRVVVRSQNVSSEAARWDLLLARILEGDPLSLWGPVRFFEPCEEPELRAELERLAGAPPDELDERELRAVFRERALELMRFLPPSRSVEPRFVTLEGDPVAFASATWDVRDVAAAAERMRELGGLAVDEPLELDLTVPRADLVARRPELPPGAVVLESSRVDALDAVPFASLRLEGDELRVEALSEERLAEALEIVAHDLGDLVELRGSVVTSVDEALAARSEVGHDSPQSEPLLPAEAERRLLAEVHAARLRSWLDEPHPRLRGCTPREAARGAERAEVVSLLRQIENSAERSRRLGEPALDVTALWSELGLDGELAA